MIFWAMVRSFFSANGLLAVAILSGVALFAFYDNSRVERGKAIERAKTERANNVAAKISNRVRSKSRERSVLGLRDPYSID